MPVTLLLVPRIQNAIYTLFHPIQTKGADYAHHNTTSPPPPGFKMLSIPLEYTVLL